MLGTILICVTLAMHGGGSGKCVTNDGRQIAFRLQGIDAPETSPYSRCRRQPGVWACSPDARPVGLKATSRARSLAAEGARCVDTGERSSHNRIIVRCTVHGDDLGAAMVREGLAISEKQFGDRYRVEQAKAKREHQGAWG
jgi:endonuclease YncB( thermonuclease family)